MSGTIYNWEIGVLLLATAAAEILLANYLPQALYVDLYVVFAGFIGLHSPPGKAAVAGSLFGLSQDVVLGVFLGLNGFAKTLVGFIASRLSRLFSFEGFFSRFLLLGILTFIDSIITLAVLLFFGQPFEEGYQLNALLRIVVTAVIGGIVLQIYYRVKFPRKDFRRLQV